MFALPISTERLVLRGTPSRIAIEHDGDEIGEVTVAMSGAHTAEITFAIVLKAQRRRFAGEAIGAIVEALFASADVNVNRIVAMVDDRNTAAMAVIEPLGFRFEGIVRHVARVEEEWVDRAQFALARFDRDLWLARPRTEPERIEFVELLHENSWEYSLMTTHRFQEEFVSPMRDSFRHALLPEAVNGTRAVPWFRGIEADGVPVGFLMIAVATDAFPYPYVWRLLIDRVHQRRGIGKRVMAKVIDDMRQQGHSRLDLSWGDGPGSPAAFYRSLGFVATGVMMDDEHEAVLNL
ncbi:MAG: GNAT family N-acetyltransferase [Ilumatobacteraceae bacterium]